MKIAVKRNICLYWLLLSTESAGAVLILWNAVPIYRRFLVGSTEPESYVLAWAILAVLLIQVAYWSGMRIFPSFRVGKQIVLGHVVLFLARLNFVFVGAFSSVVFFVRFRELQFSLWRGSLLLAVLFSMFCYTLELERFGRSLSEL
jgi:hypothetical protein